MAEISAADPSMECKLCGLHYEAAAGRQRGSSFECSGCSSACAAMRRNLGSLPLTGHISKGHVKIIHEDCAILVDSCVLLDGHFFLKASCLEKMDTQTFGLRTLWRQRPRHGEQINVSASGCFEPCSWKQQYTKDNHKFFCILR